MTFFVKFARDFAFNKGEAQEASQLKMKLFYLKIIKACRLLFLSYLGIGISLVFLFSGIVLFHITFFYTHLIVRRQSCGWVLCLLLFILLWLGRLFCVLLRKKSG
jgi:hypothetical protein